ncbi:MULTISPECIES: polysialyltransferase family glycosyltransferase [Streptomycetaceae]|uniref:Capsule polysaccharide biosynthesis protein n=1 Tax=Streptantibioticus cattleyicolor (strain ATCC 35852 / DSM 46488 / JCM 4925 / NBRC 14057 / NRRL 8057) TaxID=1003195 RepID=F8K3Z8_STREN|nr:MULTISPECIES: polysialyltransferase family glycosyltransferase [Streptomycetaceae]AEW96129.1 hypothetical protein SCATT_37580 [Streptantibioticus cattleyicolor NRRL 8057 = DSM 46488]MYS60658.1 hypothetical protein [Streptomyces sp. SID5468]CCB76467.1 conserved protein of unknown function [Streptantibioticus cattleyicolor NRRL 8057 = DSM 46488]
MARTQILLASTLYGVATLAAALDAGCLPAADRRLLVVSNNAAVPETTPGPDAAPGFGALRDRFDQVVSWNGAVFPFHPGGWSPRPEDVPLWERHLRSLWDLGADEVSLVVESIQVEPALALVRLFPDAPVEVYADGLMSYGPTRNKLDPLVATRIRALLHLDLVPGLTPLLLTEYGVPPVVVPSEAFSAVLSQLAAAAPPSGVPTGAALLLGQYLSALGILTAREEEHLHLRMLRGVAARGHRTVVFKPHPSAPAHWTRPLEKEAAELGVELRVVDTPVLAEVLFTATRPELVAGCFSTALMTASSLFGLPVARTGTAALLERLTPYQNSNRVPVTLVDALLPPLDDADGAAYPPPGTAGLVSLVRAVGYCMQPSALPGLRDDAVSCLAACPPPLRARYFKRRRLASLALPGGVPARLAFLPRNALARRLVRRARAIRRRVRPA